MYAAGREPDCWFPPLMRLRPASSRVRPPAHLPTFPPARLLALGSGSHRRRLAGLNASQHGGRSVGAWRRGANYTVRIMNHPEALVRQRLGQTDWHFVAAWQSGSLAVWRSGSLAVRQTVGCAAWMVARPPGCLATCCVAALLPTWLPGCLAGLAACLPSPTAGLERRKHQQLGIAVTDGRRVLHAASYSACGVTALQWSHPQGF